VWRCRINSEVLKVAVTENHRSPIGKEIGGHVPYAFAAVSRRRHCTCKSHELAHCLFGIISNNSEHNFRQIQITPIPVAKGCRLSQLQHSPAWAVMP
jgi:hypothetical protein